MHKELHEEVSSIFEGEYAEATQMLEQMDNLRRIWMHFQPPPPLKRSDMMLLGTIHHLSCQGKSVTVGQLARKMRQSAPAISQKLNALEELGFIRRQMDKNDRRVATVEITPQGGQVAAGALRSFLGRIEKAMNRLGPQKTRQLTGLMQELTEAIEAVKKENDGGENDT